MTYIVIRAWNGGSDEETFTERANAYARASHNRRCGFNSWVAVRP